MDPEQVTLLHLPLIILGLLFFAGIFVDLTLLIQFIARRNEWESRASGLARRPWDRIDTGFMLAAALLPIAIFHSASMLAINMETASASDLEVPVVILQTGLMHGLVLLTAWRLVKAKGISLDEAFGITPSFVTRNISQGIMSYIAILPLVGVAAWIARFVMQKYGFDAPIQYPLKLITGDYPLALKTFIMFAACISAPIIEELLFRGVAMPYIARKTGTAASIIIVSVIFASIHMNTASFLPIFILSAGLSLSYVLSGSLLTSIIMHSLFNTVSLVVMLSVGNPEQLLIK